MNYFQEHLDVGDHITSSILPSKNIWEVTKILHNGFTVKHVATAGSSKSSIEYIENILWLWDGWGNMATIVKKRKKKIG